MKTPLTIERLKEVLSYDPLTGQFMNLVSRGRAAEGTVAGSPHSRGYLTVSIDGRGYLTGRLAWFYMTGRWPDPEVDHQDTNRRNDSWGNLREATRVENCANQNIRKHNTSGFKGVSQSRRSGKWRAKLRRNYEYIWLGTYNTKEEAAEAYRVGSALHHGKFGRTS